MPKFRVNAVAQIVVVTEVEADSWQEAEEIAEDRELDICVHGSEFTDGLNSEEFTLVDGTEYQLFNFVAEEEE